MPHNKIGVVLLNMGGPDGLADVPEYLRNIFRDPAILDMRLGFLVRPWLSRVIVKKRAPESAARYAQIGGRTPLNGIARRQASGLGDALAELGVEAVTGLGMRYWHPFSVETLRGFVGQDVDCVVALSMYPHYSCATTGSSLKEFRGAMKACLPGVSFAVVESWAALPVYVDFLAAQVLGALGGDEGAGERVLKTGSGSACPVLRSSGGVHQGEACPDGKKAVLFTAHSLPVKLIARGDPYRRQVEETFRLVRDRLPEGVRAELGWQSAFGPAKWLEPDSMTVLSRLREAGIADVVVAPLGFAAENIETMWDVDIALRGRAAELGFASFARTACPNDDPRVLRGLAELVAAVVERSGK